MTDEQESYDHDPPGHDGHEHDADQQLGPGERDDDTAAGGDEDVGGERGGHDHGQQGDHDHHHHDLETVGASVVTVSSSRSLDDDTAGDAIKAAFEAAGDEVVQRELVVDDFDAVQSAVSRLVGREDTDVVVTTGGTGVTPDDVTVEAVAPLLDKELPGFGELFRDRSREAIGTRVVGTRAAAGVVHGVPVFCLPGSENAARLGAEEIIVPEASHLAGLARRDDEPEDDGTAGGESEADDPA